MGYELDREDPLVQRAVRRCLAEPSNDGHPEGAPWGGTNEEIEEWVRLSPVAGPAHMTVDEAAEAIDAAWEMVREPQPSDHRLLTAIKVLATWAAIYRHGNRHETQRGRTCR